MKVVNTNANLDSLIQDRIDIALVENYVKYQEGLNSAFSVYSEVLAPALPGRDGCEFFWHP